jgi:hypothetical protein
MRRLLENYKNIHIKKDIYVVGSGPSLDFIDPNFFCDKIVIGVNQIYKKIRVDYLLRKEAELAKEIISTTVDKNIIHFISEFDCGAKTLRSNLELLERDNFYSNHDNIVIFEHNNNETDLPDELPRNGIVVSYSTITSAIHLAAYMGASNIILVGHDCGTIDNKCNATNYHTQESLSIFWKNGEKDYRKWILEIEKDTIKLKKIIKEQFGCNIYSLNPFINFGLENHVYSRE